MGADVLLARLDKVKQTGDKKWMACCSAHDDRTPSLAVQELDDGRVLVKCFAGCGAADVMAAVGLSLSDLFADGAVAQQLKGWAQMCRQPSIVDAAMVEIGRTARRNGQRLSLKERDAELQAFMRSRGK